jgi:hypothetical protein
MGKAQQALSRNHWFEAERLAAKALDMARAEGDFNLMARIALPLRQLYAEEAVDLSGLVLASPAGLNPLSGSLAAGERRAVPLANVPAAGDLLALGTLDGAQVFDAVRALDRPRGRTDAGAWAWPTTPTPGAPNAIAVDDAVVLHEILYHPAPIAVDGAPVVDRTDEWIELYNRGDQPVDLSGWTLTDAVTFTVPAGTVLAPGAFLVVANDAAAFAAAYPGVAVLGDFGGRLDNDTDHVVLRDAAGNTADAVRYFDDGRWPAAADGGGSSLERRDPDADPAVGETWAASDSGAQSAWVSVQYDAVVGSSPVGPDGQWEELVLGLLDAGEVLIDDLSVVRDPGGADGSCPSPRIMISAEAPLSLTNRTKVLSRAPIASSWAMIRPISRSITSTMAAWIAIFVA